VARLGTRPRQAALRAMIRRLCAHRELTAVELASLLDIRPDNLTRRHLTPMVERGELSRRYPDVPNHPDQAYRS
jgi:predicted ArsR family transcriptional regulator